MKKLLMVLCILAHAACANEIVMIRRGVVSADAPPGPSETNYWVDIYSNNLIFWADSSNDLHFALRDLSTNEWGFEKFPNINPPQPSVVGTNVYGHEARGWLLNGSQGWRINSPIVRGAFTHLAAVGADTSYTFSCWVRITNMSVGNMIFDKGVSDVPNLEYCAYVWTTRQLKWVHGNLGGHATNSMAVWTPPVIESNKWHHLVFSFIPGMSNAGMNIYVDGVKQVTTNQNLMSDAGYISMQAGLSPVSIGMPALGNNGIHGYMFDPRVYSGVAWTSNDVTNAYAMLHPTNWLVEPIAPYLQTNWSDPYGVVAVWNMNVSNGVYYSDPVGGYHATNMAAGDGPVQIVVATNRLGEVNKAARFDFTNDYMIVQDADVFTPHRDGTETGFTITAWVYMDSYGDNSPTIWSRFQNPYESAFWVSSGKGYARLFDPANNYIDGSASQNTPITNWTFLAVTYSGSKSTNGFANYIECWKINTIPVRSGAYAGVSNRSIVAYIGRYYGASATYGLFDGDIDEIRYYTNRLSPSAIRRIFWQTCPTQHFEVLP